MSKVPQDKIISKIQKLLAMAESSNEHEAKIAAEKAAALMVEYNLTQQTLDLDRDYIDETVITEPYIRPHQGPIINLMTDFFFVKVYIRNLKSGATVDLRRKFKKQICFVGTDANVKTAVYVFGFLSRKFQELWLSYKKENGLGEISRRSYYYGLYKGIEENLKRTKTRVEEEKGLVLVADPGLLAFMEKYNVKKAPAASKITVDAEAIKEGFQDGKEIRISKGLESSEGNQGKLLK